MWSFWTPDGLPRRPRRDRVVPLRGGCRGVQDATGCDLQGRPIRCTPVGRGYSRIRWLCPHRAGLKPAPTIAIADRRRLLPMATTRAMQRNGAEYAPPCQLTTINVCRGAAPRICHGHPTATKRNGRPTCIPKQINDDKSVVVSHVGAGFKPARRRLFADGDPVATDGNRRRMCVFPAAGW